MPSHANSEDPASQLARAVPVRAPALVLTTVDARDPLPRDTLAAWLDAIPLIARRDLSPPTRARLGDARRICAELARVLAGVEHGEGCAAERTLHLALARGRVQGVCSMFGCQGGTFVELLVTAPWNVLGPDDPPDPRTVRGAGTALVEAARRWSARRGCGGRVALQAENPRAAAFYERLGFFAMGARDAPLRIVPKGDAGKWSRSILRVAHGRPGKSEARSPWMLLDPRRAATREQAGPAAARAAAGR